MPGFRWGKRSMNRLLRVLSGETASAVAITFGGTAAGLILWVLLIDATRYLLS